MFDTFKDELVRHATTAAASLAPRSRRRAIKRRARGREEARRLARADCAIVSYGKSGRTWINVMLSRFFQLRCGLPQSSLLHFDNLHRKNKAIPRILFTHDNYLRDYLGSGGSKAAFYDKPTLLLVRHPGDVAVSQFFQWRYRMLPHKKGLNGYPPHGAAVAIADFVLAQPAGLAKVVRFMNEWAHEVPRMNDLLVVRYEDLRADTRGRLRDILSWMKQHPTARELEDCVAFAAIDNMRNLETRGVFRRTGGIMRPGDKANPDSYKVRRAKVGGYRDYFDDDQVRRIEAYIRDNLHPVFRYGSSAAPAAATPVAAAG